MSKNEYPFKEWMWPKSSCVCLVKVRANIYYSGQRVSTAWHSNDRISSAFRQNSNHSSVSKNTRIVLSVHVLGGMIPQRVLDASMQSSKLFVCALDSHEKLHSRPKSSDVSHWVISSTTLRVPTEIRNVYAGLFRRPFSSNSNPVLSVSCFASRTHMKIMNIYRENISLTVNLPPPPNPFTSFAQYLRDGIMRAKFKAESSKCCELLWNIPSCQSPLSSSVGFTSLVGHICRSFRWVLVV